MGKPSMRPLLYVANAPKVIRIPIRRSISAQVGSHESTTSSQNNPQSDKPQSDSLPQCDKLHVQREREADIFHYHKFRRHIPYRLANEWQQKIVDDALAYKAAVSRPASPSSPPEAIPPPPKPRILTFSPKAVYTTGRREKDSLSEEQIRHLKEPVESTSGKLHIADVVSTLRGGQITFHGPGQLVIYPIFDLRAVRTKLWPNGITPRCYVNLLEETTIKTLAHWNIKGVRTENPGVWLTDGPRGERKIAALGLHLRRNITSFGVGLNLSTDLTWYERIVACGLEGKGTTSMKLERPDASMIYHRDVARRWVDEFTAGIWGETGVVAHLPALQAPHGQILDMGSLDYRKSPRSDRFIRKYISRESSIPKEPTIRKYKSRESGLSDGQEEKPLKIIRILSDVPVSRPYKTDGEKRDPIRYHLNGDGTDSIVKYQYTGEADEHS